MQIIKTIFQLIWYIIKNPHKDFQQIIGNIDTLTGLYNRNKFEEDKLTFKQGDYICITDCNGLKQLNDTLGHAQGDILIKSVAHYLRSICNQSYRIGGDEFLMYIIKDKVKYVEKMLEHCHFKVSYGFQIIKDCIEDDMREADINMYEMKKQKKIIDNKKSYIKI